MYRFPIHQRAGRLTRRTSGLAVAAAIACIAPAAHSQSSVTLFGALDTGLMYQSTSAASFSPKAPDRGHVFALKDAGLYPSFWGLRGIEDLGGGYRAIFRLQGAFNRTNGALGLGDNTAPAGSLFNQMAYVGLDGPFGTVTMGRQVAPMAWAMRDTDVRGGGYFGSILIAQGMTRVFSPFGWVNLLLKAVGLPQSNLLFNYRGTFIAAVLIGDITKAMPMPIRTNPGSNVP